MLWLIRYTFKEMADGIDAEAVHTQLHPVAEYLLELLDNQGVCQVQVGLRLVELVQVVLVSLPV